MKTLIERCLPRVNGGIWACVDCMVEWVETLYGPTGLRRFEIGDFHIPCAASYGKSNRTQVSFGFTPLISRVPPQPADMARIVQANLHGSFAQGAYV